MILTRQTTMDLQTEDGERPASALPLINVGGARSITGLSEDGLDEELGQRRIRWAWNIALNPDPELTRRELRFLEQSLWCWRFPKRFTQPEKFEDVLKLLVPENAWLSKTITSTQFEHMLVCGRTHIANLCEGKQLLESRSSAKRAARGPNGKRIITLDSAITFLKTRLQ
jgi:hypothetical protein